MDFKELVRERKGFVFFWLSSEEAEMERGQVAFSRSYAKETTPFPIRLIMSDYSAMGHAVPEGFMRISSL